MVGSEFLIDDFLTKEAQARAGQKSGLVALVQRFAGNPTVKFLLEHFSEALCAV